MRRKMFSNDSVVGSIIAADMQPATGVQKCGQQHGEANVIGTLSTDGELGHRAATLACVHLEDCLLLDVGFCTSEAPSDINRGSKPAFQHIARDVKRRRDGAAAHIASIDGPFVEMPGLHGFAGSVIRIFADPARAKDATVAYLKQATFQMLGHDIPLFLADSIPPRAYSHLVAGTAMPTFSTATVRQTGA